MKIKSTLPMLALIALLLVTTNSQFSTAHAQGTAFTYQGQLYSGTNLASGKYDFQFALSNAPSGGTQIGPTLTNLGVGVTNGLFITTLDFGAVYAGQSNWLGISVRSNATGGYVALSPLQKITPTPYAVYAESANASNLVGTIPAANLSAANLSGVALLGSSNTFTSGNQIITGGSVGIGTATPIAHFHVNGGIFESPVAAALFEVQNCGAACALPSWTEGVRLMNSEGNDAGLVGIGFLTAPAGTSLTNVPDAWIGTDDKASGNTHSFQIATQSGGVLTNRVFINGATGNVGIGTNNPSAPLYVLGNSPSNTANTQGVIVGVQTGSNYNGAAVYGLSLVPGGNGIVGEADVAGGGGTPVGVIATSSAAGGVGLMANASGSNGFAAQFNGTSTFSGNVGIGTTTPSNALQVVGTVTATSFSGSGAGLTNLNGTNVSGAALLAGNNNFTGASNSFSGSVGIGTTAPFTQLANTPNNIVGSDGYGLSAKSLCWYASGLGYAAGFYNPSTATGGGLDGVVIGIANTSSRILDLNAGGNSVMVVNGNGAVGIGTNTPATALQVNGTVTATSFAGNGAGLTSVALLTGGNNFTGVSNTFSGKVGIGTSTPNSPLAVFGNIFMGKQRNNTVFNQIGDTIYLGAEQKYLGNTLLTAVGGSTDWINLMANPLSGGIMFGTSGASTTSPHSNITAVVVIKPNGRMGIGTPSPAQTLEVNGNALIDGTITATTLDCPVADTNLSANVALLNAVNNFTGANNYFSGNLGIGTSTPGATLDVSGTGNFHTSLGVGGIATHGALDVEFTSGSVFITTQNAGFAANGNLGPFGSSTGPSAIYANGLITTTGSFIAFSDQRVKNIIGRSDSTRDLNTLLGIEITDFRYKDTVGHGNAPSKKVIAQQVEKVFPQAVSRQTGELPDIYQKAAIKDGWVQLATDLKVGEQVKLIAEGTASGVYEVLEVKDGAFRTGFKPTGEKVFVYGRQVNDLRTVDYDAIAMLNVSATQELARKVDVQESELTGLRAELAKLRSEKESLASTVAELKARDQACEDRLTRLESSLEKVSAHGTYASLKQ